MFEVTVNGTDKLPVKLVDATDHATEEPGITTPTVYYSKAGGVATQLSTPTLAELDATNMPGVYLLTLTTAMTDTTGPLVVTVTAAGCAPASLVVDVKAARLTAAAVWAATDRTLSSFGTLVADMAAAVWGAGTRTLSAFGFTVAATVADKTGYALTTAYDAAKTAAQASDIPVAADNATAMRDMLVTEAVLEADGADYRLTANALELAPAAGASPDLEQVRAILEADVDVDTSAKTITWKHNTTGAVLLAKTYDDTGTTQGVS